MQVEVPPPRSLDQRVSILKVHTSNMHEAGRLLVDDPPEGTAAFQQIQVSSPSIDCGCKQRYIHTQIEISFLVEEAIVWPAVILRAARGHCKKM